MKFMSLAAPKVVILTTPDTVWVTITSSKCPHFCSNLRATFVWTVLKTTNVIQQPNCSHACQAARHQHVGPVVTLREHVSLYNYTYQSPWRWESRVPVGIITSICLMVSRCFKSHPTHSTSYDQQKSQDFHEAQGTAFEEVWFVFVLT